MTELVVLLFHENFGKSRANAALARAISTIEGVKIVYMHAQQCSGSFDGDTEVGRLLGAPRLLLQFPVQWYSTPSLLKQWQDVILTRMFYRFFETEGKLMRGTPFAVAATAGNLPEAYTPEGQNLFSLEELLKPLHATAYRCGLKWCEPFIMYRSNKLNDEQIDGFAQKYRDYVMNRMMKEPARGH